MSITLAGWPCAAARLIRRPSAEDEDVAAVGEAVFIDEFADALADVDGHLGQADEVQFHIEVAGVADHRAIFHRLEVLFADHVDVARDGDEDVADFGGILHGHHFKSVHNGFNGLDRIDFRDDGVAAHAPGAEAAPLPQ